MSEIIHAVIGSLIIAGITAIITAAYYRQRNRRLYDRGWRAGREFQKKWNPDT